MKDVHLKHMKLLRLIFPVNRCKSFRKILNEHISGFVKMMIQNRKAKSNRVGIDDVG